MTTVKQVKADLRGWRLGRCVFTGDAGMNSEDNRKRLALGGGKYILAAKMRGGDEAAKQVMPGPGRYKKVADNLRVKEVFVGGGERRRRYVVCHNPVFHYRPWRIQTRVTLSVLGLLLERIAEIRAGDTWRNIRDQLNAIQVIEYEHTGTRIRQATEVSAKTKALLKRLKVPPPPTIYEPASPP